MIRKIGLFFLSLWLLFALIIIITADIPYTNSSSWEFVGWTYLLSHNIIPIICVICLIIGVISFLDFKYAIGGSPELSFQVKDVENIDYEHLTFLTTYIVPLVCFNFESIRYLIVFVAILVVIGLIYVRTDLFYANPTLAVLNFRIYKVEGTFGRGDRIADKKGIVLIVREKKNNTPVSKGDWIKYVKLDERIYYAYK